MKGVLFALLGVLFAFTGCYEPAYAHETWRGLTVAEEHECSPYVEEDYRYPQSLKHHLWLALGAPFSPKQTNCLLYTSPSPRD